MWIILNTPLHFLTGQANLVHSKINGDCTTRIKTALNGLCFVVQAEHRTLGVFFMGNEMDFGDFWAVYLKPTGIGAAKRSWSNQIFFHNAKPEQIIMATKKYAEINKDKEKQFIPNPAKFLDDQTYLDEELQEPLKAERPPLEGWKKDLAVHLGESVFYAWCDGAELTNGVLKVKKLAQHFQNMYSVQLSNAGVLRVVQ